MVSGGEEVGGQQRPLLGGLGQESAARATTTKPLSRGATHTPYTIKLYVD